MARTAEELEVRRYLHWSALLQLYILQEEEDIEEVIASDSDDDDSAPYNPKNLPLGWDGKVCFIKFSLLIKSYSNYSPSHIGCTSYMDSTLNIAVKFVVDTHTEGPKHFNNTFL